MKKAIKIKVSIIMLAWMILFLHSIIPHNHIPDSHRGCLAPCHEISPREYNYNITSSIDNQPEESNVCHLSSFLYNQSNNNNILFYTYTQAYNHHISIAGVIFIHSTEIYFPEPYHGTSSLRAPPVG